MTAAFDSRGRPVKHTVQQAEKFVRRHGVVGSLVERVSIVIRPPVMYVRQPTFNWTETQTTDSEAKVFMWSSTADAWEWMPIDRWDSYFPHDAQAAAAKPLSETFWRGYSEPLKDVVNSGIYLNDFMTASYIFQNEVRP